MMRVIVKRIFLFHPVNKFAYLFIFKKSLASMVILGQFAFTKHGMNFIVANTVHAHLFLAAMTARYQVVLVDGRTLNEFASA